MQAIGVARCRKAGPEAPSATEAQPQDRENNPSIILMAP
jgi:hypothetical protein